MKIPGAASWLLRIALAAIYIIAAVPKIADPWGFALAIRNFRILPLDAIPALALWLPPFELLAAVAVLSGLLYRGGLAAIALLSAGFAAGVASAMIRGLDIDCGCFGSMAKSSANLPHLLMNLATAAAAVILLLSAGSNHAKRRLRR